MGNFYPNFFFIIVATTAEGNTLFGNGYPIKIP